MLAYLSDKQSCCEPQAWPLWRVAFVTLLCEPQ